MAARKCVVALALVVVLAACTDPGPSGGISTPAPTPARSSKAARDDPGPQTTAMSTVRCQNSIATMPVDPANDVEILGSFAFAYARGQDVLTGSRDGPYLSTKVAIKVRPGASSVKLTSAAEAYFRWGNDGDPPYGRTVTVQCPKTSHAGSGWLVLPGSILTKTRHCLRLKATSQTGETQSVELPLGEVCPAR